MDIVTVFCEIDDFCQQFEPVYRQKLIDDKVKRRNRAMKLQMSEILTIIVYFHSSGYRNFKTYYLESVQKTMSGEFPNLVSYNRFVELMKEAVAGVGGVFGNQKSRVQRDFICRFDITCGVS